MRTPQTASVTIPAGNHGVIVPLAGKWLEIIACSATTLAVGFDADPPQVMYPGRGYPCAGKGFQSARLVDTSGAGCTATVTISDEPLAGQEAGVMAHLASIDQEISGAAATQQRADLILPVTPGPGLSILAANTARTEGEIHAPRTNGAGLVYLGITAARCTAVDKFEVLSAGESWYSDREKGAIFGCSSTGAEIVVARES